MVKWFCAKVFSIVDRSCDLFAKVFSIVDWSRDLSIMVKWSIMEKTFANRSRDLSTIEKTFAQGKIMHLQSVFHYGDFMNATIREWELFCASPHVGNARQRRPVLNYRNTSRNPYRNKPIVHNHVTLTFFQISLQKNLWFWNGWVMEETKALY